jgi:orotidine-5'-phosphate decarboxylase
MRRVSPQRCRLKIGLELFTAAGPEFVRRVVERGFDVFLDLKFHDIPNTAARACARAAELGVWMINVHTLGGPAMMRAARDAVNRAPRRPLLIGVTMLTSHDEQDLSPLGVGGSLAAQVRRLAGLARDSGLDGVVCSAQEARDLRTHCGRDFVLVTPGIRPAGSGKGDQQRVMTPAQAIAEGSDYLVVGRPITEAPDPAAALEAITSEIGRR